MSPAIPESGSTDEEGPGGGRQPDSQGRRRK